MEHGPAPAREAHSLIQAGDGTAIDPKAKYSLDKEAVLELISGLVSDLAALSGSTHQAETVFGKLPPTPEGVVNIGWPYTLLKDIVEMREWAGKTMHSLQEYQQSVRDGTFTFLWGGGWGD